MTPYPLIFEPILKHRPWGGRRLTSLGKNLPDDELQYGECWELADLARTNPESSGGGEASSLIDNGKLKGLTLHQAIHAYRRQILGELSLDEEGRFPILLKYLDAREPLSIQVHPSGRYLAEHPEYRAKDEAWYVVHAEPEAYIFAGLKPEISAEALDDLVRSGQLPDAMIRRPVSAGDCLFLPSGVCHSLGGGVLVAEVQTPSDDTFRLYDWNRGTRELHIEQAEACIAGSPPIEAGPSVRSDGSACCELLRAKSFILRERRGFQQSVIPVEIPEKRPRMWMVLRGRGLIISEDASTPYALGQTLLLPPGPGEWEWRIDEPSTVLEITFPE